MQTYLIFARNFLWPHHFMEIIDFGIREVEGGSQVFVSKCNGEISYCATNPLNISSVCKSCIRIQSIFEREFPKLRWVAAETSYVAEIEPSEEQLKNTLGSVFNTAPYLCNKTEMQLKDDYKFVNTLISAFITDLGINHLLIWNGRRTSEGDGAFHQKNSGVYVTSIISASGSLQGFDTYIAFAAPKIHDMAARKRHISDFAQKTPKVLLSKMSEAYFGFATGKSNYKTTGLPDYQKKYKPIKSEREYDYIILNGTFHEFYGHLGWELDFGVDFNNLIQILLTRLLLHKPNAKILVRWHPNLRRASRLERQKIRIIEKQFPIVKFVAPNSNLSTHDLIKKSKICFSIGSSVVIEASKIGLKYVYFIGRNYFEDLKAFQHIRSLSELDQVIINPKPTAQKDVDLFGAYLGHREVFKIDCVNVFNKQIIETKSGVIIRPSLRMRIYFKIWQFILKYLGTGLVKMIR